MGVGSRAWQAAQTLGGGVAQTSQPARMALPADNQLSLEVPCPLAVPIAPMGFPDLGQPHPQPPKGHGLQPGELVTGGLWLSRCRWWWRQWRGQWKGVGQWREVWGRGERKGGGRALGEGVGAMVEEMQGDGDIRAEGSGSQEGR